LISIEKPLFLIIDLVQLLADSLEFVRRNVALILTSQVIVQDQLRIGQEFSDGLPNQRFDDVSIHWGARTGFCQGAIVALVGAVVTYCAISI